MFSQDFSSLCLLIEDRAALACLPIETTQGRHATLIMVVGPEIAAVIAAANYFASRNTHGRSFLTGWNSTNLP